MQPDVRRVAVDVGPSAAHPAQPVDDGILDHPGGERVVAEGPRPAGDLDREGLALAERLLPRHRRRQVIEAAAVADLPAHQRHQHPHRRSQLEVGVDDGVEPARERHHAAADRHRRRAEAAQLAREHLLQPAAAGGDKRPGALSESEHRRKVARKTVPCKLPADPRGRPSQRQAGRDSCCGSMRRISRLRLGDGVRPRMLPERVVGVNDPKILLPFEDMPRQWYNLAADLPDAAAAAARPGRETGRARRARRRVPDEPDRAGDEQPNVGSTSRTACSRSSARWRPTPLRRAYALEQPPRDPGEDLLQGRERVAAGQPQAQHRGRAGLVQQAGRDQAPDHRDRRRPVGLRARLRLPAARPPGATSSWCGSASSRSRSARS